MPCAGAIAAYLTLLLDAIATWLVSKKPDKTWRQRSGAVPRDGFRLKADRA
jgi:hypothetical protein